MLQGHNNWRIERRVLMRTSCTRYVFEKYVPMPVQ